MIEEGTLQDLARVGQISRASGSTWRRIGLAHVARVAHCSEGRAGLFELALFEPTWQKKQQTVHPNLPRWTLKV